MKNLFIPQFIIWCIICTFLYSCSSGPSDDVVIKLATPSGYISKIEVQKRGKSSKIGETKVYSATVYIKGIQPGMLFGYINECPEAQCYQDTEYEVVKELLIGKDKGDKWDVYKSRTIEEKKLQQFWRPKSKSIEEFYKEKN